MTERLKRSELAEYRAKLWRAQGKRCAVTGESLSFEDAVLDHDHKTGHIRGVIHRGVNSLLGKVENNYRRCGLSYPQMLRAVRNFPSYIQRDSTGNPLYPTFRTEEEKRERKNAQARKRYRQAKELKTCEPS